MMNLKTTTKLPLRRRMHTVFKFLKLITASLLILIINGCATIQNPKNMVAFQHNPEISANNDLRNNVYLLIPSGANNANAYPWSSYMDNMCLNAALMESLKNAKMLTEKENAKYILLATVMSVSTPTWGGFTVRVTPTIHYKLKFKDSNKTIWSKTIGSTSKKTVGDAFFFFTRVTMASEEAVKQNIEKLITKLINLDINPIKTKETISHAN